MIEKVCQIADFEDGQVSPESDAKLLEHEHFQIGPFNSLCINSSKKSCFCVGQEVMHFFHWRLIAVSESKYHLQPLCLVNFFWANITQRCSLDLCWTDASEPNSLFEHPVEFFIAHIFNLGGNQKSFNTEKGFYTWRDIKQFFIRLHELLMIFHICSADACLYFVSCTIS